MHSTVSLLRAIATGGVFAAVSLSVLAQDVPPSDWNHFGLDFRMGFNIRLVSRNCGSIPALEVGLTCDTRLFP